MESHTYSKEHLVRWDAFLRHVRVFLRERGYYEVQTPTLVPSGAFEASIDCLQVRGSFGSAELHTSPEMQMKQLLSDTHLSVYQICRCYRDDPRTPVHRREFTMLEFYRVYGSYEGLQRETIELLKHLSPEGLAIESKSVRELFLKCVEVDLDEVQNVASFYQALKPRTALSVSPDDSWPDLFFKAWVGIVEPALVSDNPILVRDYPLQIAALAAPHPVHPRYSQRFEIYWRGMELCNGAQELASETTLLDRYQQESELRRKDGKLPHPRPEALVQALKKPMPECAGVAIGLERLFAAIHGQSSICPFC
jgi:elongation factor P--(R)-beta-lysine ligase